jgi:HAD superfamily hydrolase (TIGR01509 family)
MTAREVLAARTAPLRLVIFDCDGVLVDSEGLANAVTAEVITAEGWPLSGPEAEHHFVGLNLEAMVPIVEARIGRPLAGDWVVRLTERLVDVLGQRSEPIPGALAALEGVSALGLPWRVASNSSHAEMAAKFARIGIAVRVAGRVHSYTDVPAGKPAPDLFLAAADAEGVEPAGCVVIEDSVPGARAAAAAGMTCLGYAPRGRHDGLIAAGAGLFGAMAQVPVLLAEAIR